MLKPAVWAEHHIGSDHTIRSDECSRANFGSRINNRTRVNFRVAHLLQPLTSILSPLRKGRGGTARGCSIACIPWPTHSLTPLLCRKRKVRGSLHSFIEKREHQFGFGDDCVVYYAVALRFRHAIATRSRQL